MKQLLVSFPKKRSFIQSLHFSNTSCARLTKVNKNSKWQVYFLFTGQETPCLKTALGHTVGLQAKNAKNTTCLTPSPCFFFCRMLLNATVWHWQIKMVRALSSSALVLSCPVYLDTIRGNLFLTSCLLNHNWFTASTGFSPMIRWHFIIFYCTVPICLFLKCFLSPTMCVNQMYSH